MGDAAQDLIERVRATIADRHMLAAGETVLAAVSGGPDSMGLLHALVDLGYTMHVAHFDHQTRNGASAEDADFVRDAAQRLGLPFHLESRPVADEARKAGESFEAYARAVRYAFFRRTANAIGCAAVATGHHADDRAETVLMRMLRGTWPAGLAAIPAVREDFNGGRVIRPLIECSRGAILAFLHHRDISYRVDESNADTVHSRNRVRQELIPLLTSQYNPRLREALCRLAELQHDASDVLRQRTGEFMVACYEGGTINRAEFARGPIACQRELLVDAAERNGVEAQFDRIERARRFLLEGPQHKSFDFGGGVFFRNEGDVAYIATVPRARVDVVVPLEIPGETPAFGHIFRCRILDQPLALPIKAICDPARQVINADRASVDLFVRTRRNGDRFVPLGMAQPKKLKDYFIDRKLPLPERDFVPLVCSGDTIAWVVGHTIDARVAVTTSTKRFLMIEVDDATQ